MEIIAEIGSNWITHYDCIHSIAKAKEHGADAVKFQYFTHQDLYGVPGSRSCLPDLEALNAEAEKHGIEFMCTAFSPGGYQLVDRYVKRHKIASSEITAIDILSTVGSFKKPVFVSTGGATTEEIDNAVRILEGCEITLLYCVTDYPARVIDFRNIERLRRRYQPLGCKVGYSDHSTDVLNVPTMALVCRATVIEKHVNFLSSQTTPDAPHSLSEEEFSMMVRILRSGLSEMDTFRPNPWKRRLVTLESGKTGYFRPLNV